ncbi:MAG TPA: cupin domain-containing protein [Acidimicrobiales bacterium]|nr:cupin domain-containing protein [Acidimicrobiales bacterium]
MLRTDAAGVHVVRNGDWSTETAQTAGLPRRAAIWPIESGGQSQGVWVGRVTGEPGMDSGPHHHGEAETVGYVLSGRFQLLYGEDYSEKVELGPGDFIYVPAFVPHIERNLWDEPVEFITVRRPDNIVVNLDPSASE